jgi:D-alanyl-D-alanine carboxypeptidase
MNKLPSLLVWLLSLLSLPLLTGFGPPRLVDQVYAPTQQVYVGETTAWLAMQQLPARSASAHLLYDMDADRLLFAKNADQALPVASLTKLMTALLVLEQGNLETEVVVQASDLVGGTSMQLVPGEVISVENLLWGMLIPSGNDAATALARHTSGSVEAFAERMNQRAAQLGLTASHFVNPHGLDADGHVSSANDLLRLVQLLWDYPLFRQIVATPQATVNGHLLQNTNQFLGLYSYTNGIKTGTTDNAGQCLVAGMLHDGHQVVVIVLGSSDRYQDVLALYEHYQQHYTWVSGNLNQLSVLNRLYDTTGKLWYLRSMDAPPTVFLPAVEGNQLAAYRRITAPVDQPWQSGMQIGVVEWHLGEVVVATQPLYLW